MKFVGTGLIFCLVNVTSIPAFSEEEGGTGRYTIRSFSASCEQQAINMGIEPGIEFENFLTECEKFGDNSLNSTKPYTNKTYTDDNFLDTDFGN